jgi:hypothetical protein
MIADDPIAALIMPDKSAYCQAAYAWRQHIDQ